MLVIKFKRRLCSIFNLWKHVKGLSSAFANEVIVREVATGHSKTREFVSSDKMQTFKIEFTAFVLIYLSVNTRSEVFEIFRSVNTEDGVEKWTDTFKIPPSLCRSTESSSTICAKFNARASGNGSQQCICSCSRENATFMFYKNQWTCLRNSKVRDVLGK